MVKPWLKIVKITMPNWWGGYIQITLDCALCFVYNEDSYLEDFYAVI